jgi:hypothetical protein
MRFSIGVAMLGASVILFLIAMPRRGEVVWYLRDRDGRQAGYLMFLMLMFLLGGVFTISGLN